jgi:hypothetical protein
MAADEDSHASHRHLEEDFRYPIPEGAPTKELAQVAGMNRLPGPVIGEGTLGLSSHHEQRLLVTCMSFSCPFPVLGHREIRNSLKPTRRRQGTVSLNQTGLDQAKRSGGAQRPQAGLSRNLPANNQDKDVTQRQLMAAG